MVKEQNVNDTLEHSDTNISLTYIIVAFTETLHRHTVKCAFNPSQERELHSGRPGLG